MKKHLISILVLLLLLLSSFVVVSYPSKGMMFEREKTRHLIENPMTMKIYINGNENFTSHNGVSSGSGTIDDPFIIKNISACDSYPDLYGIVITNTNAYFEMINCQVVLCVWGMNFNNVTHAKVRDCIFFDNNGGKAMNLIRCSDIHFEGCLISENCGFGVCANNVCNSTFSNCSILKNTAYYYHYYGYGMQFYSSSHDIISDCIFYNNYNYDINFNGGENNSIQNCFFNNGTYTNGGAFFNGCKNSSVINCNSTVKGFITQSGNSIKVLQNKLKSIEITSSENVTIQGNNVNMISLKSAKGVIIINNTMQILGLESSNSVTVVNNNVTILSPMSKSKQVSFIKNNIMTEKITTNKQCKSLDFSENYWKKWWGFGPKIIIGFPRWFLDWHPAQEPYDIPGMR